MPPIRRTRLSHQRPLRSRRGNRRNGAATQTFRSISNVVSMPRPVICSVGRNSGPFPDIFNNYMKMNISAILSGSVTASHTFRLNSPYFGFGPQANYTGAFGTNYPDGANWLLGSISPTGSTAPYGVVLTVGYEWTLELVNSGTAPAKVTLLPSVNASFSGMAASVLAEQRGAAQILVPPNEASVPLRIQSVGNISELFGETNMYADRFGFTQVQGGFPTYLCYMHYSCTSLDGSTNVNMQCNSTIFLKTRWSQLNPMSSNAPTLRASDKSTSSQGWFHSS